MACLQFLNWNIRVSQFAKANWAVKTLMPFATMYLCKSGFSALTSIQAQTVCGK